MAFLASHPFGPRRLLALVSAISIALMSDLAATLRAKHKETCIL